MGRRNPQEQRVRPKWSSGHMGRGGSPAGRTLGRGCRATPQAKARVLFPYSPPLPLSSLCQQIQLPALGGFSLPQITSPCHIPAEFCGSGCAYCCVNRQISFLGVQDGLVLIWLYFMDARHKKNFNAVLPSWLLPTPCLFVDI